MTVKTMRKKVIEYLETAKGKDVKAIFTLVEDKIETDEDRIDDKTFKELKRKELKRRTKSFLDGSSKMYSLEDAKIIARERFKTKNNI
jgi:hypothetical protein